MQEESKEKDSLSRKSWPDLEGEEESKNAKVEMIMQQKDNVTEIVETGKETKIKQIVEAYEQEAANTKTII